MQRKKRPHRNPHAVAIGMLAKKKCGPAHYKRIGELGGRPRIYSPCEHPVGKDGYRRHQFAKKTGICWGCGKTREQVKI